MTERQLARLFLGAMCYLMGSIIVWGIYGLYLVMTGQG